VAAAHLEVSSSRHPRRAAVVYRAAPSVLRRREASSKAFRREARLSKVPLSEAQQSAVLLLLLLRAAFPWVLRPAFPARAWCQPEAARRAVARLEVSSWSCLRPEVGAAGLLLQPAAVSAWCVRAAPSSREAAAVSDAGAAQPWAVPAEPGASARPPVVAREEVSAAAVVPQRAVPAAVWGAAEVLQQVVEAAVRDAAEGPQQAAEAGLPGAAAELQPVAAQAESRALRLAAVRPSAALSAFRRDRPLPWPVRRRAARSARAMRRSQAESPSERSWQAARCEGLS